MCQEQPSTVGNEENGFPKEIAGYGRVIGEQTKNTAVWGYVFTIYF